jgi:predicted AlkP superfamily pyrophosphatase or phosphodiesterase
MTRQFLALVALVLFLAACTTTAQKQGAAPDAPRSLILISIDGFRADYLDRGITPTLGTWATDGVRADGMRPSFPTVTFPNHYTIVTGLRPDRHGIVNNYMQDPQIPGKTFKLSDREVQQDPRWWNEGEPIWVTAEKAGLRTATLFWPGSETEIRGHRPRDWTAYDKNMKYADRVDRVLSWLDRPAGERPRFLTLYFESVDN